MTFPPLRAILLGLLLLPLTVHVTDAAKTYKWVDEDGVTHYTQQPPPDADAHVIEPAIGTPSTAGSNGDGDAAEAGSNEGSADGEPETLAAFCEQLRDEMTVLNDDRKVSVRDGEGNLTPLEGEKLEARKANLQQRIDQYCSDQ